MRNVASIRLDLDLTLGTVYLTQTPTVHKIWKTVETQMCLKRKHLILFYSYLQCLYCSVPLVAVTYVYTYQGPTLRPARSWPNA